MKDQSFWLLAAFVVVGVWLSSCNHLKQDRRIYRIENTLTNLVR